MVLYVVWAGLSVVAATAMLFLSVGVAVADAYGVGKCTSVAGDNYPSCVFEHGITGQGLRVSSQFAEAEGLPATLCHTRIDFQYLDEKGSVYRTNRDRETWTGCRPIVTRRAGPETLLPGRACAILYSGGSEISRQCHVIKS